MKKKKKKDERERKIDGGDLEKWVGCSGSSERDGGAEMGELVTTRAVSLRSLYSLCSLEIEVN